MQGYLIVLYLLLTVIRFFLFSSAYPIISRMGLKSSVPEMIFQSFGGLRGAVGIALAISLDNTVRKANPEDPKFELQTDKLFGFVGGIAFMTLMINATTAGPLLRKLGLADTSSIREKILNAFTMKWRSVQIDEMVRLMATQKCYASLDFAVVRHHIPELADLTVEELTEAAAAYREANSHQPDYQEPYIRNILDQLERLSGDDTAKKYDNANTAVTAKSLAQGTVQGTEEEVERPDLEHRGASVSGIAAVARSKMMARRRHSAAGAFSSMSLVELRRLFLEMVRGSYNKQLQHGELTDREFAAYSLFQSLDLAADAVQKGDPLRDWEFSAVVEIPLRQSVLKWSVVRWFFEATERFLGPSMAHFGPEYLVMRLQVERSLAFVHAHKQAQHGFREQLASADEFSGEGEVVLNESRQEVAEAEEMLLSHRKEDLETVVSHKFCSILLLNAAREVEEALESGMIKPTEAEEALEEIQEGLQEVNSCDVRHHESEAIHYESNTSAWKKVDAEDATKDNVEA